MMQPQKFLFALIALVLMGVVSNASHAQELRMSEIQKQLEEIKKQFYKAPEPAPLIPFNSKKGELNLSEFKGKTVILHFWATWCVPCIQEMPGLIQLKKDYAEKNIVVVPVSIDFKGLEKVQSFLKRKQFDLPAYADKKARLFNAFKGDSLPMSVLIDSEGYVSETIQGYVQWDSNEVRRKIDSLI